MDTPLTAFTPLINKASIGLSPKALSFYFLFPDYLAVRGMAPRELPLTFFALLAHVRFELAERILSSPAPLSEAPEGLGA
jgi:hypothetical protein